MSELRDIIIPLVAELRSLDSSYRVFGTRRNYLWWRRCRGNGHCYRFNKTIGNSAVDSFQRRHGIQLPDDYREFITRIGDGGAGPHYGVKPLAQAAETSDFATPFPWCSEIVLTTDSDLDLWETRPGVLVIADRGCGASDFLVVNGVRRGQIWNDYSIEGLPLSPTHNSFIDWYLDWAQGCIATIRREPLIDQVHVGMTIDEVCAILGEVNRQWGCIDDQSPDVPPYNISFTNTNASFTIGADHRVTRINRWDQV